ncbi:MAG: tail fiber domain-containing protein [Patescibacteria group bacterium]
MNNKKFLLIPASILFLLVVFAFSQNALAATPNFVTGLGIGSGYKINFAANADKVTWTAGVGGSINATTYTGNASTSSYALTASSASTAGSASTLAGNGNNCTTGNYPLGIDASGNAETCTSLLWSGINNGIIYNGDAGAGNVGIGTTSPLAKLAVVGTSYFNGQITNSTLAGTGNRCLYVDATGIVSAKGVDCGTSTGGDDLGSHIATQNIQLSTHWLSGDGGNEGVYVDSTGNVGVGTSVPGAYRLNVSGPAKFTSSVSSDTQFLGQAADLISTPSFAWTGDLTTGMYHPAASQIGLTLGGVQRALFTATALTLTGQTSLTASSLTTLTTGAAFNWGGPTSLTFTSDNATINGSDVASGNLTLQGTSNATRTTSYVLLQPTAGNVGIGGTGAPNDSFSIANVGAYAPVGSSATGHNYTSTYLGTDDYALTNTGYVKTLIAASNLWEGTKNGVIYNGDAGAGNVGIGTTTPGAYRLYVNGNSYILGTLNVSSTITGSSFSGAGTGLTGTAASLRSGTATALAANGTNCGAGYYPAGIDASGNAEGCLILPAGGSGTVTGTGTTNYVTKWASSTGLTISSIFDNGTGVGIGTTLPGTYKLNVAGMANFSAAVTGGSSASFHSLNLTTYVSGDNYGALSPGGGDTSLKINVDAGWPAVEIGSFIDGNISNLIVNGKVGIGTTNPAVALDVLGAVKTSRLGSYGTYNAAEVQGIWSISEAYPMSTANDNFGAQYGMGYAYSTNGGAPFLNTHQIVFTNNGAIGAAIGLDGKAYFGSNVGIGTTATGSYNLNVAGTTLLSNDVTLNKAGGAVLYIAPTTSGSATLSLLSNTGGYSIINADGVNDTLKIQTGGTDKVTITSLGKVGIGTTNPGAALQVIGSVYASTAVSAPYGFTSNDIIMQDGYNQGEMGVYSMIADEVISALNLTTGTYFYGNRQLNVKGANVGIGTTTPVSKLEVVGNVLATSYTYSSDRNLKKNIKTLDNSLDKIMKLRGVSFNWKADGAASLGLVAQEVEKVYPELVSGTEGAKGVQYGNLVAPLIEAVKAQQKEIDTLEARIKKLELKNKLK